MPQPPTQRLDVHDGPLPPDLDRVPRSSSAAESLPGVCARTEFTFSGT